VKGGCSGRCPVEFLCVTEYGDSTTFLIGKPVPVFDHPHSENVISYAQMQFSVLQFVSVASSPFTGYHREESGFTSLSIGLCASLC